MLSIKAIYNEIDLRDLKFISNILKISARFPTFPENKIPHFLNITRAKKKRYTSNGKKKPKKQNKKEN
jgi:hypothetical protein